MGAANLRSIHINFNPLDMGRPSHWDRTGLSAALDVQDEVGLFFSFIKFPFGLLLALTLRPFCASQVHGAVHARVQLLHLRPPEQRRRQCQGALCQDQERSPAWRRTVCGARTVQEAERIPQSLPGAILQEKHASNKSSSCRLACWTMG